MKPYALVLIAALAAAACSGDGSNPFDSDDDSTAGGGGGANGTTIPESVAGNVTSIAFNSDNQTLVVAGVGLDNTDYTAAYTRAPVLDVIDENNNIAYMGFFTQSDPLDRPAYGYARETLNSGAVRGAVAVTGGNFNRYFGGTFYERDGFYTPPTVSDNNQGLVSYAGDYVGVTNTRDNNGIRLPVDPSVAELSPSAPAIVEGRIFLNVDFADNRLEGIIYDRDFRGYAGQFALPNIILIATDIDENGQFFGEEIEFEGVIDLDIGDYAGIFGGPNAEGMAGGVRLTEFDGQGDPLGFDGEEEYGVFVLDQCGTPDENLAVCNEVRPEWP